MKNRFLTAIIALSLALSPALSFAASFVGKDATGATKNFKADGDGSAGTPYIPHHILTDGSNTNSFEASGADGVSNTASRLAISAWLSGFNGTTWDRLRTGGTTAVSSFTGYLNTLPLLKYNSTPPSLSNGQAIALQGNAAGALKVDGSAVTQPVSGTFWQATQPVSGTVTANIGTSGSLALDATLTGGTQKSILRGGAKGSTSAADVTSTASGSNHQAADVVIYDTSGNAITSFGGGTQYTEGDVDSTITGTAALWEDASNTLTAASAAKPLPVNIISGAGSGGTAIQDDSAFTVATSNLTPAGGTYKSVRDSVDDNDAGAFAMTAKRALYSSLETPNGDSAMDDTNDAVKTVVSTALPAGTNAIGKLAANDGVDIGDVTINNSTLAVTKSGTWDITNAGTFAVQDNQVVADNGGFTDGTTKVFVGGHILDETAGTALTENDAAASRIDSKRAQVMVIEDESTRGRRLTVTASNAMKVDGSAVTQPVSGTITASNTAGDVAHDGADSGNPVKVGGKAVNAEPTAVANADRANFITDLVGKQITLPYANPENFLAGKTSDITGTSDTAVIAAQGAGVRIYVTQIIVTNSHSSVNTWVNIKDGTTTIYTGYAYSAGGGFVVNLPVPLRLTANTALNAACETTGANVRVSASGYKGS